MGKAASQIAKSMNAPGYHYPWESAYTGFEVSPEKCPSNDTDCLKKRLFTTTGVALAIRYYISMTRDRDFMINTIYQGCDMSREVTKFLASQLTFNEELKRFELLGDFYSTKPSFNFLIFPVPNGIACNHINIKHNHNISTSYQTLYLIKHDHSFSL